MGGGWGKEGEIPPPPKETAKGVGAFPFRSLGPTPEETYPIWNQHRRISGLMKRRQLVCSLPPPQHLRPQRGGSQARPCPQSHRLSLDQPPSGPAPKSLLSFHPLTETSWPSYPGRALQLLHASLGGRVPRPAQQSWSTLGQREVANRAPSSADLKLSN